MAYICFGPGLFQGDTFHLCLTARGIMACLSEDMEWKMMELGDYQCHFEELFMVWVKTITNHVIS